MRNTRRFASSLVKSFKNNRYSTDIYEFGTTKAEHAKKITTTSVSQLAARYKEGQAPLLELRQSLHGTKPAGHEVEKLVNGQFQTLDEMMRLYETLLAPLVELDEQTAAADEVVAVAGYKVLDKNITPEKKAELEKQLKDAKHQKADVAARYSNYVSKNLSVDLFNSVLNALRVAADTHQVPDAYQAALRVLNDMAQCGVVHNHVTQFLARAIIFGDSVSDNSPLLFACIESPEKGEVVASAAPLDEQGERRLVATCERRHNIDLTSGGYGVRRSDVAFPRVLPPSMLEEHDTAVPTSVTHGIATSIEALMHGGKKPRTRKE